MIRGWRYISTLLMAVVMLLSPLNVAGAGAALTPQGGTYVYDATSLPYDAPSDGAPRTLGELAGAWTNDDGTTGAVGLATGSNQISVWWPRSFVAPSGTVRGAADAVPDPVPVRRPSGAPNRDSPWYVSYRDADGNLQTVGNAGGLHAEVRIQEMAPGTQMSRPFGWRTVDGVEGPQWVPGTVCAGCQQYPPTLFSPGTEGAPGGPWGW